MPNNNKPIRVLEMVASLYMGGSQAMIMNIYKKIDRTKVQFDFVVDHPEFEEYLPLIEELGGKVYTVPTFNGKNIKAVQNAWDKIFIEHPEYKILHSHARSYASLYLPIAKKHGVKTIIHSHNTSNGSGISALVKNILQFPLRYQADYFFGCSKDSGKWLFGEKVANSDNYFVLNNAIDAQQYRLNNKVREEYRKQFNVGNRTVYLQVGSLTDQKNHMFTIEMFSELYKINKNIKLYLVGVGENEELIKQKIKENNLGDVIELLGRRKDVNNLLQMADCYIMPSLYEGLSVAAIEAQASGITCLLSDTVSSEVKICDNVKFIPLDVNKWVEELNKSFVKKDTYQNIVDAGYDINQTSKWLQEFYLRIENE